MKTDIPNTNATNPNAVLMPFRKYVECFCEGLYHEETKYLEGVFKDNDTKEIIKGDNFTAHVVGKGSAEETYRAYIQWYNHTKSEYEHERTFVNAKFKKQTD